MRFGHELPPTTELAQVAAISTTEIAVKECLRLSHPITFFDVTARYIERCLEQSRRSGGNSPEASTARRPAQRMPPAAANRAQALGRFEGHAFAISFSVSNRQQQG